MASFWRDPVRLTFIDADNQEIAVLSRPEFVPRVGENVRIKRTPHIVERVGYDIAGGAVEAIWIVCRPA
ncbi:hypothetical protein [uncultured Jatrophihabitans sp.]|uniref:hypothetical protein n=1 Tax=uncultured Jatrophihabitans sp. TaxID=1610747 RepID=UPI0035CB2141